MGVFGQQSDVRTRLEITRQGPPHAVGADPALAAGGFNHRQRGHGVQAQSFCQSHGFGSARQIDCRQQIVDQLGAGAVSCAGSNAKNLLTQGGQQLLASLPYPIGASHHQTHGALLGAQRAAGHGRIDEVNPHGGQTLGLQLHGGRPQSRTQHDHLAWLQTRASAAHAPQHRFGLRCVDHSHQQDAVGCQALDCRHGRAKRHRPMGYGPGLGLCIAVVNPNRPAQRAQTGQHAAAHVASTDEHDGQFVAHVCTSCFDLAIDMRMPSARPRVTIAVPP